MQYVELVAVLAVIQFLFFGVLTGRERGRSGLAAPAMTGDAGFERMYRVQMNTLELLVAFLPSLFLAARYWSPAVIAGIGAVYLIGRFLYWRAYIGNPPSRGIGFATSMIPVLLLVVAALVGILLSLAGVRY